VKNVAQSDSITGNANFFRLILLVTSFIIPLTKKGISHVNIRKVVTSNKVFISAVTTQELTQAQKLE